MYYYTIAIVVLVAAASAQVSLPPGYKEKHPYAYKFSKIARERRDVRDLSKDLTWEKQIEKGMIFGVLGGTGDSLYGKAGYKQDIFKDDNRRLTAQAYGARHLNPGGDSSHYGGRVDYYSKTANAAIDISRQIGGTTSLQAEGNGVWKLDKNTDLSAGGMVRQESLGHGRPDIGVQAKYEKRF